MAGDYFIGLDIGGSSIKGAAVSPEGNILTRSRRDTESKSSTSVIVDNISLLAEEIRESQGKDPIATGIGVPGAIQFEKGVVSRSPHFPHWMDYDLRSALSERILSPIFIDNDANCAALGELWMGGGRGCSHFCLLTLGTGIGGGLILGGKIFRGVDGMAAEIGHIIVEPEGRPCGCGGRGCLEKYVSAHSAVETALELYETEKAAVLRRNTEGGKERVTSKLLHDLAREGDPFCLELFQRMGRYLGMGFVDIIHIFNLERIIIGGGMMASWDLLVPEAIREMKSRAYKIPAERVEIAPAQCGEDAGTLGAVFLAKGGKM
ncbi:MAG: ROK family protein [Nitrospinae bacterium]|nr:ROK family protein [Nitrospinota bacterium]